MTAVKERLVEMVPRMPLMIADLEEEEAQVVFNILIKREKPKTVDVSKRIGAGKGEFEVPEDFDAGQEEIYAEMEKFALS